MQNQQEGMSQKVSEPSGDRQLRENIGHRFNFKLVCILGVDDMLDSFKNFDRQCLTAIHNKARLYLTHPQVGKILHMNDEHEEEYRSSHEATESANELVPVSLKDLKIGERNEGVVLFGELCVEAFKFVRIYTPLNEVGAGNAVALSIVSPIPSSIDQSFPRCTYPQGRKIAVKEPLLVQGEGGILFINVGNPLSIETTESLPASADINVTVGEEKFNRWKECADKALITNDWKKCVRYATKCLSCLSQGMPVDRSIVIHMFVLRWQAYLNLCRYQEALADAEKCYELNNSELTPIISSLLSVGRYKKAFQLLENSYALFPEQKDNLVEVYRRCGSLYFEISEAILQLGLRNPNVLKPDADFIGPVEIRMTRNGCNRGLFATEDIEEGQVLLLSKGLAMSGRPMKDQNALLQNVKDALASCGETTRQFFLSHGMKGLSHFIPKMSDFITGSAVGYPVNWATVSQKYYKLAEKEKNRKILLILNCIALDDSCPAAMQENCKESVISSDVPARLYYGVWLLPSFINHSCLPNAARINVGEIQRIHATRKISKDKEITIPYFNVFVPYPSRQRSSAAFGFSCVCEGCEIEAILMNSQNKFKNLYKAYSRVGLSRIQSRATQLQSLVSQVENCANFLWKERWQGKNGDMVESWHRASFTPAYFAGLAMRRRKLRKNAVMAEVNEIDDKLLYDTSKGMIQTCPGSLLHLIFIQKCIFLWSDRIEKYARWELLERKETYELYVRDMQEHMMKAYTRVYGNLQEHVKPLICRRLPEHAD